MKALSAMILSLAVAAPAQALELADMITDSISAHPEVKEKIHVYRQLISDRQIAQSGWRPSVDLQASTGLYDTESPATGNNSVDYDSSNLELSVTQNLFNGYDTTHQIEQTEARINAALFDIFDTADNIALRATQAYMEVIKQRRLYELAIENVESHEEILAQVRDRSVSGVGRRSQLQQTEGRVARAHASLIAQQNNLQDASSQFHQILGRYVDPQNLREPLIPDLPPEELNQLIDRALEMHPAMRVAHSNIQAASADHQRSLRTRYPEIDLRLASEYGDDIGGLSGNTEETSLVLNLRYNLYRGGRNSAEQQKKISAVYEQKEFAARVRRQIINSLRLSWMADSSLFRQLEFLQQHVVKAGETTESYREEFFIGQRDLIDLLDAENELNSARNQYTEAKYDALSARYRVYEGMGQFFPAAGVKLEMTDGNLTVARLYSAGVDKLPLPVDEDEDKENDDSDHCDNSLKGLGVNPFGCLEPVDTLSIKQPTLIKNSVPVPVDDRFTIETNGILIITAAQLLANDSDADSDPLQIADVSQPEIGRLAFNKDNNIVYRPTEGFIGVDSFTYRVTDNNGAEATARATVEITVRKATRVSLSKLQLVNFKYDEDELTEISKTKVEAIIEQIRLSPDIDIEVYTYTDNIGSDAYNLALSKKRAEALKRLLVENGIDSADITAVGMGEKNPIADNSTEAGQAINRRGEFLFKAKTPVQ